ncbi:MAG: hypothetical protein GWN96_06505, partial [candidate division Zixibacteria bacterium]|nr:hypothetical protein [candidate division Zixibacteria bacterium]
LDFHFPVEVFECLARLRPQALFVDLTIMAKNTVQYLNGQVPAATFPLDAVEKPYTLNIMLEATDAMALADSREIAFTVVPEWGVPNVMAQGNSLD